jgi:hypothetical protein
MSGNEILIVSRLMDVHGLVVERALSEKGAVAKRWTLDDFSATGAATLSISNDRGVEVSVRQRDDVAFDAGAIGVVWHRRPTFPMPATESHPDDWNQIYQEGAFFVQSIWRSLAGAAWVNPQRARWEAKNKLEQLRAARGCGFLVPDTLYSNDPAAIRTFVRRLGAGKAIYKPHRVFQWEGDGAGQLAQTAVIADIDDYSDACLHLCPGIYQGFIRKKHELRVTVMGQACLAAKIVGDAGSRAEVDWRQVPVAELGMEPATLEPAVRDACLALMRRLGLVFGCIDLIVDEDGGCWFLEVNEMGQFLWVEGRCPDLPLLDTFCSFLALGGHAGYDGRRFGARVDYGDFRSDPELNARMGAERRTLDPRVFALPWVDALT